FTASRYDAGFGGRFGVLPRIVSPTAVSRMSPAAARCVTGVLPWPAAACAATPGRALPLALPLVAHATPAAARARTARARVVFRWRMSATPGSTTEVGRSCG